MSKVLNEETLVPIGLAVVAIGGITAWAVEMRSQVSAHTEVIAALTQANESQLKLIHEVNSRLSRIEWKLENEQKRKGERNERDK